MGIGASIGNFFKGKNNKEQERIQAFERQREEENKIKITHSMKNVGGPIEFRRYKPNMDMQHFYDNDTTVMIINPQVYSVEGQQVFNCKVGWTRDSNAVIYNEYDFQALDYQDVFVSVNIPKLIEDGEYAEEFMRQVLSEEHVMKYVNMGLEESPKVPCGNYIGGIYKKADGRYQEYIDPDVGKAIHNSKMMVDRRQANRKEQTRKAGIDARNARRREEIARLQAEIEGDYGDYGENR